MNLCPIPLWWPFVTVHRCRFLFPNLAIVPLPCAPSFLYRQMTQQSLNSVSLISAGYERERAKWRVCWSFSISLALSLSCRFVFEPSSVFHCAMGIYCVNGHGLQVGLAYMGTHTHIVFSPFPRCMHAHLCHGVIYHHSLHYLSMIFLHCLPIQLRKIS